MAEIKGNILFGPCAMNTALGDADQTFSAMTGGISGLRESGAYGMIVGEMPHKAFMEGYTALESTVIALMQQVLERSSLSLQNPDVRFIFSSTKGNIASLEGHTDAANLPQDAFIYSTAVKIADYFQAVTAPIVISNACISGVSALVVGRRLILAGECTHVIVVGCDLLCEFITSGFASFKSISSRPLRPYDSDRDGLNLGEACGCLLLTADRSKAEAPYIRFEGGSVSNDANHISGPSRTGDGLFMAISSALKEAGLEAGDISYVNTHGTATVYNDEMESKALALSGLSQTPTNSLKGYIGHTLGASGVVETIVALMQMRADTVLATAGFARPGTPLPVNVSAEHRHLKLERCVKTASGFGGCNAAVVLAMESCGDRDDSLSSGRLVAEVRTMAEFSLPVSGLSFAEMIRQEYHSLKESNMKFFKMSDLCKAAYIAGENLCRISNLNQKYEKGEIGVIMANSSASLDTDVDHQRILEQHLPEGTSPAVFVYTLPSVAAGELCIRHKFMGDNTFFIDRDASFAEKYATMLIRSGVLKAALCGWCDKLGDTWNVNIKILEIND